MRPRLLPKGIPYSCKMIENPKFSLAQFLRNPWRNLRPNCMLVSDSPLGFESGQYTMWLNGFCPKSLGAQIWGARGFAVGEGEAICQTNPLTQCRGVVSNSNAESSSGQWFTSSAGCAKASLSQPQFPPHPTANKARPSPKCPSASPQGSPCSAVPGPWWCAFRGLPLAAGAFWDHCGDVGG